jgi:hypothetical protein
MNLDIGAYRLRLPAVASVPSSSERLAPFRAVPLARLGPFELSGCILSGKTLQDWREFVEWTTKNLTQVVAISVNGIPGLRMPGVEQRLDYAFQAPGEDVLQLVAWSDSPTNEDQRELLESTIQTLQLRPRRPGIILPE